MLLPFVVGVIVILVVAVAAVVFFYCTEVNRDFAGAMSEEVISSFLLRFACFDCAITFVIIGLWSVRIYRIRCICAVQQRRIQYIDQVMMQSHQHHCIIFMRQNCIRIGKFESSKYKHILTLECTRAHHTYTYESWLVWMQQEKERERAVGTVVFVKESDVVIVCQPWNSRS